MMLFARPCLLAMMTLLTVGMSVASAEDPSRDSTVGAACVVLLHGLARSAHSLSPIADALEADGYIVVNPDYPSRHHRVRELTRRVIPEAITACHTRGATEIHAVTHSLGGILVRYWLEHTDEPVFTRVVMLAPPNQGSEVVDVYRAVPWMFAWLNGPAGLELGTGPDDIPASLGPVSVETGVIAGSRTLNWILSQSLPNPDDGKVSVASTRVDGMCAHLTLAVTHPLIMRSPTVIAEVGHFLRTGRFASSNAEHLDC